MITLADHAQSYSGFNTAAVMTFAFPLILFAAALLWLYFQRSRR